MATNKNFTMQQYNGTDYDVLYPKNTSQQTLLNDSTLATALGITASNPEIDQALTEIVNKITALENGAVKIQTGSYVGTGTYGSSNPCSLTFDFIAEYIVISASVDANNVIYNCGWLFPKAENGLRQNGGNVSGQTVQTANNGKTINWYNASSNQAQLNMRNTQYQYLVIG